VNISSFHAYYLEHTLSSYNYSRDRLMAAMASPDIEVYLLIILAALISGKAEKG
jgi:hypothetical protein